MALLSGALATLLTLPRADAIRAQEGLTPPAAATVRLRGADGKRYNVAEMRGRVVVVSYGATWCGPCVAELGALEELKGEYAGKPVTFWWVSIESESEKSDVLLREYAKDLKLTLPVLRDLDKSSYGQFSPRMRIPLVVFFDKEGAYVPPVHVGMATPELYKARLRERIDPLLKR